MTKTVMISIKPKWCELISNGKKTIEVRKTRPKLETPFKCYIYCTKDGNDYNPNKNLWKRDKTGFNWLLNGKVIGEFVCDTIYSINEAFSDISCDDFLCKSCLSAYELLEYLTASDQQISIEYKVGYGWHISDLVIYDIPKPLDKFPLITSPQSWCYVQQEDKHGHRSGGRVNDEQRLC